MISTDGTKHPADLYVSPAGSDANAGTIDKPLATLVGARDAIRRLKVQQADRDFTVLLHGGTYALRETTVFSLEDSAAPGRTITYAAYPGETPILSSGVSVTGWRNFDGDLPGLPDSAMGKLWVAAVPKGLGRFVTLYDGQTRLPRARTKGFVPPERYERGFSEETRYKLVFPPGAVRRYENLADAELVIRPNYAWILNILPLESVDEAACTARTAIRGTYALGQVWWAKAGDSAWIENVADGMLQPGNWMLDTAKGLIYLWPTGDKPGDGIVAPTLTELVRVEGGIDYDGPADSPVTGLAFRGLTFTHGDRFTWQKDKAGWGIQHDWEMFDRPTAMLRFRGAESCAVEGCRFANSGGAAVRLDLHCRKVRVFGNVIEHIGGGGVLLAGYGPGTKDVNRDNEVVNNHIHHVGEILWHGMGVFAWQSGWNLIAHNLIHNCPYTGISVTGRIPWDRTGMAEGSRTVRWHEVDKTLGATPTLPIIWRIREQFLHGRRNVVEYNDISRTNETLFDGNGVYISGTGGGNVVRANFVHDNDSPHMAEGIRCDDDQHDTLIDGNVIYRTGGLGTGICSKGRNDIVNNIIACPAVPKTARGMISLEPPGPHHGSIIQRNILYATRADHRAYGQCLDYSTKAEVAILKTCKVDYNAYFNSADADWGDRHLQANRPDGNEQHSLAADPLFVNLPGDGSGPTACDFRLRDDSPALKLGFRQVNIAAAGLLKNRD